MTHCPCHDARTRNREILLYKLHNCGIRTVVHWSKSYLCDRRHLTSTGIACSYYVGYITVGVAPRFCFKTLIISFSQSVMVAALSHWYQN